jgi:acylphosphatase
MTDVIAVRWVVQGRVQGVGFRWYVQNRAEALGVRGWVRNLHDGSVEVVGAAEAGPLEAFEAAVRGGPPGAHVTAITREHVPHDVVDAKSFTVKR